jgi:decaprenylphospho-beta-D-ribofuranose 2-oxidase
LFEKKKISSFDQNCSLEIFIKNSDKYKELDDDSSSVQNLITMGSCYSYVAASFKEKSLSINVKNFNRILFFDKEKKIITVEAGMKIFELLNFTLKHDLWIPQIPGHPFISIGGAVASNVHGKSCAFYGTIKNSIKNIKVFHKYHGWLNLNSEENEDIFDLTIGGLGLTGTIISVTFILHELNCSNFLTTVKSVDSISQTVDFLESSDEKNLTYSWNTIDSTLDLSSFGKGLIFENQIDEKNNLNSYKKIKFINKKKIFPFNLWNNITIKYFNCFFFIYHNYIKKTLYGDNFSNVVFPFYNKEIYFSLFGHKGFIESQILISKEKIYEFLEEFKRNIDIHKPSITIFSLKKMSGKQKYLRFEDNKICLTFDMVSNKKNAHFLNEIYKLYIKYNVLPSIIKDSNLDKETFNRCYKEADIFREKLKKFDPKRIYRSELSDKLNI